MSLSSLPLCYCTNVHAGQSVSAVLRGLDDFTLPISERFGQPLAAGLWLAAPVVREILSAGDGPACFADELQQRKLTCHTLNTFPYGDFHAERVKENVYLPDWTDPRRLQYTQDCATVLAALLPDGVEGSLSTVPLGFKEFPHPDDFRRRCGQQLLQLAGFLHRLSEETGKQIRLAVEPEPFCVLETTGEAVVFFEELFQQARQTGQEEEARRYLGLCYDVCHQAVEFEEIGSSIRQLDAAGIRINKLHITCALKAKRPGENTACRETLARYVEPRYLHQTLARTAEGRLMRCVDLTEKLALQPPADFAHAEEWRVHFHVPVDAERLGPLETTRPELKEALQAVARLSYPPHLEVETYTWEVLPENRAEPSQPDLVAGLTKELQATHHLLEELRGRDCGGGSGRAASDTSRTDSSPPTDRISGQQDSPT